MCINKIDSIKTIHCCLSTISDVCFKLNRSFKVKATSKQEDITFRNSVLTIDNVAAELLPDTDTFWQFLENLPGRFVTQAFLR